MTGIVQFCQLSLAVKGRIPIGHRRTHKLMGILQVDTFSCLVYNQRFRLVQKHLVVWNPRLGTAKGQVHTLKHMEVVNYTRSN